MGKGTAPEPPQFGHDLKGGKARQATASAVGGSTDSPLCVRGTEAGGEKIVDNRQVFCIYWQYGNSRATKLVLVARDREFVRCVQRQ